MGEGRTAVLAPAARVAGLRDRLMGSRPPDTPDGPADPEVDLTSPVVVLPIGKAKGLEFDAVVLVEPAEVLAESPRGANDLYVALTRATQRLAVVHAEPLPAGAAPPRGVAPPIGPARSRAVAPQRRRAAATSAATNRTSATSSSGCHCTPTTNGRAGSSPASSTTSTVPSAAQPVATRPGASRSTA